MATCVRPHEVRLCRGRVSTSSFRYSFQRCLTRGASSFVGRSFSTQALNRSSISALSTLSANALFHLVNCSTEIVGMAGPPAVLSLAGFATPSSSSQTYRLSPEKSITARHRSGRTCFRTGSEAKRTFPWPAPLGSTVRRWAKHEIDDWMDERLKGVAELQEADRHWYLNPPSEGPEEPSDRPQSP